MFRRMSANMHMDAVNCIMDTIIHVLVLYEVKKYETTNIGAINSIIIQYSNM